MDEVVVASDYEEEESDSDVDFDQYQDEIHDYSNPKPERKVKFITVPEGSIEN